MKGKKLYRSRTKRVIAGVCGGLEDFTGIDVTIWRIIFVILLLPGGVPGFLLYLAMWIIIPQEELAA